MPKQGEKDGIRSLCIDLGNSTCRLGIFFQGEWQTGYTLVNHPSFEELQHLKTTYALSHCAVSSVAGLDLTELLTSLESLQLSIHVAGVASVLPFYNAYQHAEHLGSDRLCALVGAYNRCPDCALVVVDAGSALTLDFLDAHGTYGGGYITPGLGMRLHALHAYTAGLPLVPLSDLVEENNTLPLGTDTREAILYGVMQGFLHEIEGFVHQCTQREGEEIKVFLTGGDAQILHNRVKVCNFVSLNLVLEGLDTLLRYNA